MGNSNSSSVNHRFTSASRSSSEPILPSLSKTLNSKSIIFNCVFVLLQSFYSEEARRSQISLRLPRFQVSEQWPIRIVPCFPGLTISVSLFLWSIVWISLTMLCWIRFLQAYFGLSGSLGQRIFDMVTQHRKDDKMTFEDLVIAKVLCLFSS